MKWLSALFFGGAGFGFGLMTAGIIDGHSAGGLAAIAAGACVNLAMGVVWTVRQV